MTRHHFPKIPKIDLKSFFTFGMFAGAFYMIFPGYVLFLWVALFIQIIGYIGFKHYGRKLYELNE